MELFRRVCQKNEDIKIAHFIESVQGNCCQYTWIKESQSFEI